MAFWEYVFWIGIFIVFYNYAGYAAIVVVVNSLLKRKLIQSTNYFPSVSFIVAAFNEEDCIEKKIINSFEQVYPEDKIEFIFITDGSTDLTSEIIKKHSSIRLLHSAERQGKTAALNRAVLNAKNEILIFSDANTLLNKEATQHIARHFADKKVGGVAGEKKVFTLANDNENAASSEGFYWKYESFLKKIDSEFYSVVGAAGELFSIRKNLYEPISSEVILDDFIISMKIALKSYRIVYEPGAFAVELPSFSIQDEKKRKIRIAAGGFQSIAMLPEALFFWKHFRLSFLYISHRVLRWTLSPLCLITTLISNVILAILLHGLFYKFLFVLQSLFYLSGLVYKSFPALGKKIPPIKLSYYFTFMNVSVFQGFFRFLQRKQSAAWDKARRSGYSLSEINNP